MNIIGYAHLLIDQQYQLTSAQIQKLGYQPGSQQFVTAAPEISTPAIGQDLAGSLVNSLLVAQALGCSATLVSCIGEHDTLARQLLAQANLAHRLETHPEASGRCVILIDASGERTMLASIGAAKHLGPSALVDHSGLQLLEGYLANYAPGRALMEAASERSFALTLGNDQLVANQQRFFRALYQRQPRLLMGNLSEYEALFGVSGRNNVCQRLLHDGVTALVSEGANGALGISNGLCVEHPSLASQVVDTTGAGDALAGAWMAAMLQGYGPDKSLYVASVAAGYVVGQLGPRLTREQGDHIITLLGE